MKITCLTTFLHGTQRYEHGDQRTVSDDDGAYFVAQGWAKASGADAVPPVQADAVLDIQDTTLRQVVQHG